MVRSRRNSAMDSKKSAEMIQDKTMCNICKEEVIETPTTFQEKSIECECCVRWMHVNCVHLAEPDFDAIVRMKLHWYCPHCEGAASKLHQWSVKLQSEQDQMKHEIEELRDRVELAETNLLTTINSELENKVQQKVDEAVEARLQEFRTRYAETYPPLPAPADSNGPLPVHLDSNGPVQPNSSPSSVRLTAAVKEAIDERENIDKRKLNLILNNLKEAENATIDANQVQELIANKLDIGEEIVITETKRLGNVRDDGKPRLLRIALQTLYMKRKILSKATKLRSLDEADTFAKVYIRPDLTPKQQQESKNLVAKLQAKREADPDNRFKIQKGKIVQVQ